MIPNSIGCAWLRHGIGWSLFCGSVLAAPQLDLERIEPVAADAPVPIADFFRPAYFSQPQLNPAGTQLAALISGGLDKSTLMVMDLATNEIDLVDSLAGYDIYQFNWLNDHRLVFSVSADKYYGIAMLAVDVGSLSRPYPLIQYGRHRLIGVPREDRLSPLAWVSSEGSGRNGGIVSLKTDNLNDGSLIDLTKASVASTSYEKVREGNRRHVSKRFPVTDGGIESNYSADRNGNLAFGYTTIKGVSTAHYWMDNDWHESAEMDLEVFHPRGPGNRDFEMVVRETRYDEQPSVLRFYDVRKNEPGAELLRDKGYDFSGWLYRDPVSRQVVGAVYDRATPAVVWFDDGYRQLQELFDGYFPGKVVRIVSGSETGTVFVLRVFSDRDPSSYYVVDLAKKSLGLIKASRPWIDEARMARMNIMKYPTRDGKKLDAYVTLPAGASRDNPVPLVVLPHGGPWVRDTMGWDAQAQFLASRGYAVMQPNYRGSPGYDWMFPEEHQWDFLKMHDDVTDATKYVLRTGLIDRSRVAIAGGSFGAYLALSGAVHEPDLYKCIVAMAGVFDWREVVKDREYNKYTDPFFGRLLLKLGDPDEEKEKFHRISPIHFVENMRAPIFVAHGKDDPVASVLESRRLVAQLKKHKVPHEAMFISREGHGMGHLTNQVELYGRVEEFLAENL